MVKKCSFFMGLLVLRCLNVWSQTNNLDNLKAAIEQQIQDQKATYGIAFKLLGTGDELLVNAQDRMHAASTMKVPVMMRLFEMVDQDLLSLESTVIVRNEFKSIVDGSSYAITVDSEEHLYEKLGHPVDLETLIVAMITMSSNLATNLLIELAEPEQIMVLMKRVGAQNMKILRGVEDLKAFEANQNNESSAGAMMEAVIAAVQSSHFSQKSRTKMLEILRQQKFKEMIPAGLPGDEGIKIAHKTGAISRVQHDVGIIDLPDGRRYALAIFAKNFENERRKVKQTAAAISKLVYEYVTAQPSKK